MTRPSHNHVTQADEPAPGCPACALIRTPVMTAHPREIASGMFGPLKAV